MNRFDLKLFDVSDGDMERWNGMLLVDGELVMSHREYCVDWHQLVASLIEPGRYQHFTCTCGDADCAELGQHNVVTYHGAVVRWRMEQAAHLLDVEFNRAEAIRLTLELLAEVRAFVPSADYGTNFPVLPASFHDWSLDWCLRTLRSGKIEGTPWANMITADMIHPDQRDFYFLQREIDRPLPSAKWIRREQKQGQP